MISGRSSQRRGLYFTKDLVLYRMERVWEKKITARSTRMERWTVRVERSD